MFILCRDTQLKETQSILEKITVTQNVASRKNEMKACIFIVLFLIFTFQELRERCLSHASLVFCNLILIDNREISSVV